MTFSTNIMLSHQFLVKTFGHRLVFQSHIFEYLEIVHRQYYIDTLWTYFKFEKYRYYIEKYQISVIRILKYKIYNNTTEKIKTSLGTNDLWISLLRL